MARPEGRTQAPAAGAAEAEGARLSAAGQALLDELCPHGAAYLVRTRTRVDTGSWLGKSRVWAACCGEGLVLFAAGERPYAERIPAARLRESFYNHVTAEVALAPATGAGVRTLKVPPVEGLRLLAHIVEEEEANA